MSMGPNFPIGTWGFSAYLQVLGPFGVFCFCKAYICFRYLISRLPHGAEQFKTLSLEPATGRGDLHQDAQVDMSHSLNSLKGVI